MTDVNKCDKCKQHVPLNNSAYHLLDIMDALGPYDRVGAIDRHLFPVGGCEGSPSRVKRIDNDEEWLAAYRKMA